METGCLPNQLFNATAVNGFCEYSLVAVPDATVSAQVMEEKKYFREYYKERGIQTIQTGISVANFLAKEEMEATVIRWMHRIISNQKSFSVTLNRYGGCKPHTLYLRVQNHLPFQQLAKELLVVDQYVRGNGCPEMNLNTRPHITIAEKLSGDMYQDVIEMYAQKIFQASFTVNELVLLRKQHPYTMSKQVNVFGLQP